MLYRQFTANFLFQKGKSKVGRQLAEFNHVFLLKKPFHTTLAVAEILSHRFS